MKKYIPENIDLDKLIRDSHMHNIKEFHPEKLVCILSEIAEKPANSEGFAEIHSKRFRSFVHNYNEYLECLSSSGIIDCDRRYSYEIYSKVRGYKLTDEYSSTLTGYEITYLPIVKRAARERASTIKSCRNYKHLLKWFNPGLTVDYDSAIDYLGTYYTEKKKEFEILTQKREDIIRTWYEEYSIKCLELQWCEVKDPYGSYRSAFIAIDRIKEQDYHFSTGRKVNRFHSILTLMPSDFRNFLSYDGQELVCYDIRNSQAYFSLGLLNPEKISEIIEIATELIKKDNKSPIIKRQSPSNCLSSSIILSESLQRIDIQEFELYKNLVLSGTIYEYFEQALRDELDITYPSREAVKNELFRILFSSNSFFWQPSAAPKRLFQKLFPGLFEYFVQLKRLHRDIIPIVLQRWESYAVLQVITKRIARDYPDVPLFTIHDSIVTTRANGELVSAIMQEELNSLTGYSPAIKQEVWGLKNLKYYDKWKQNQT